MANKTKFDLRKLAFSIVPFTTPEEAVKKIKTKVAELKLNDHEILEFIKQANVASQYNACKKAGFMVNVDTEAVLVNPSEVFKDITKINKAAALKSSKSFFSNLAKAEGGKMEKSAALKEALTPPADFSDTIIDIIKLSYNDDKALAAVMKLRREAEQELKNKKGEFIKASHLFENTIKFFPFYATKYGSLVDEKDKHGVIPRVPTARDVVEIKKMKEKIASIAEDISKLANAISLLNNKGDL